MRILGFCGRRKTGKTKAAELVVKLTANTPFPFRRISFADSLRMLFADYKNISPDDLKNNYTKEIYRQEMIEFSQKIKEKDPLFFVKELFDLAEGMEYIVIDDIRFIEELAEVKKRGGIIYKVDASPKVRKERGWEYMPEVDNSLSETELGDLSAHTMDVFGGILFNNGSEEQLRKDLRQLLLKHFMPS